MEGSRFLQESTAGDFLKSVNVTAMERSLNSADIQHS